VPAEHAGEPTSVYLAIADCFTTAWGLAFDMLPLALGEPEVGDSYTIPVDVAPLRLRCHDATTGVPASGLGK
jgi:hypothetical protein